MRLLVVLTLMAAMTLAQEAQADLTDQCEHVHLLGTDKIDPQGLRCAAFVRGFVAGFVAGAGCTVSPQIRFDKFKEALTAALSMAKKASGQPGFYRGQDGVTRLAGRDEQTQMAVFMAAYVTRGPKLGSGRRSCTWLEPAFE